MSKTRGIFKISCLFFLLACAPAYVQAQVPVPTDTTRREQQNPVPPVEDSEIEEPTENGTEFERVPLEGAPVRINRPGELPPDEVDTLSKLEPAKAAFYSAVLPGMGQAYNGSHWKIPIIYVGAAFVVSTVNFYNRQYGQNLRILQYITYEPTVTEVDGRGQDYYQRLTDSYRRERDYTIILGGILYALNIVDAYVDAHLQDFDINDDLAMQVKPGIIAVPGAHPAAGIALTLNIK